MPTLPDLSAQFARLGRWPGRVRRICALACLLLAAATALTTHDGHPGGGTGHPPQSHSGNPIAAALHPGQVAAPITLQAAPSAGFIRPGDHIDLYAAPADTPAGSGRCAARAEPVATRLAVLAVPTGSNSIGSDDAGHVIVAVDRATAARIATLGGCEMLAVLDGSS